MMVLWLRFLTEINSNTKEESGDVDYEYHHIIKGLYATCSSWHIDPFYFPRKKFLARKSIKVSFFAAKSRLSN